MPSGPETQLRCEHWALWLGLSIGRWMFVRDPWSMGQGLRKSYDHGFNLLGPVGKT